MSPSLTQRMYRRVQAQYAASYTAVYTVQQATVRDISLNGMRLEGYANPPYACLIAIRLWLPDGEGMIDIDQAVVRWRTDREFGVQIIAISNDADLRLARHVEQRLRHTNGHGGKAKDLRVRWFSTDDGRSQDHACGAPASPGG